MRFAMRFAVATASVSLFAPLALSQARENNAERLAQLRVALSHGEETVALLESIKDGPAAERTKELEAATKARNAIQRLINQIEGRDENAGIAADQKKATLERKQLARDYYPALQQVKQDVELDYGILEKDSGKKNDHRNNAMKFLDQVHRPIVQELTEYERAHPKEVANQAAPAAAKMPAGTAAPAAGGSAQQIAELNDAISHLDHSIDYVNAQPASDPLRGQTLAAVTKARDTVRQLVDEINGGDLAKDQAADHARDMTHSSKAADYYSSLVQMQGYMRNDSIVISRQPDDARHLHQQALQAMGDAGKLLQQQVDAYHKAHPSAK